MYALWRSRPEGNLMETMAIVLAILVVAFAHDTSDLGALFTLSAAVAAIIIAALAWA